ncbi:copper chaperone CopZ [Mumia flava]|uniref:Copper chaperone CopZ n=1 Tax=Mumia flava TaxID=1348852 RepID=A0A0B2B754_9ACTN|nr:heavy-metal-associated domain-containing protein [Mumia flava]PJJ57845.1 copper chaperone CopZ [Mumia flava]
METTYPVSGMTCEHCVAAVTTELGELPGVTRVVVDLVPEGTSTVSVFSNAPVDDGAVAQALDEAGDYALVEPS